MSEKQILQYLGETNISYRFHIFDYVSSTNDLAKEMIREEDTAGSVIIAKTQLNGRGRNGKSFICPDGGIYVTVIYTEDQFLYKQQFLLFAPCTGDFKLLTARSRD
jgi:hypothetical protein